VGYFFIGKQKVVLFPKYKENSWESVASALMYLRHHYAVNGEMTRGLRAYSIRR
jgi:hypothetical protein